MNNSVQSPLPSVRKAAVLLDALSPHESAALLSRLAAREAQAVSQEMRRIAPIAAQERHRVMMEFVVDGLEARRRDGRADARYDGPAEPADEVEGRSAFAFLAEHSRDDLLVCLRSEHPQTVALVLSRLPAELSARLLHELPSELASSVVRRMECLAPCNTELLEEVARGIQATLAHLRRDAVHSRASSSSAAALDQAV